VLKRKFDEINALRDYSAVELSQNVRNQLLFKEIRTQDGIVAQDYHGFILTKLKEKNQLKGIPIQTTYKVTLNQNVNAFEEYSSWQDKIKN
jgi:hypothetical protein